MSIQEANDILGRPTAAIIHSTGKGNIPFYYGSDGARFLHLYKGRGRIIFNQTRINSNVWRVFEIQIDPSESGYQIKRL